VTYADGRWQPVRPISIFDCLGDDAIWGGDTKFFRDPESWRSWWVVLKVLFGEPLNLTETHVFRRCTGRVEPSLTGYKSLWLVCGRKSGKSRILALVAVFLSIYRDWSDYLSPGEVPCIKIIANDRKQAAVIHRYCRAWIAYCPALSHLIERDSDDTITLTNGVVIEIATASFRSIRGYTVITALCDEIGFWRSDESLNPDSEILGALRPAMATVPPALLLCASSPYARRGELWEHYRRYFGVDDDRVLVWQAPTEVMNPTVRESEIRDAYEKDPSWAASEYGAQFRSDLESYITREVLDAVTMFSVREQAPRPGVRYYGFCDPSGGSGDSMTLAISHAEGDKGVLDCVRERRPPFSPESVVEEFSQVCRSYGVYTISGDRYAGAWPVERFSEHGVVYTACDKSKSELYVSLLPLLNSQRIRLLDLPILTNQLTSLDRRTGRGTGRDSIDHPPRSHDDVANAVAGAMNLAIGGDERSVIVRRYLLGSRAA
jgi:hypothetical protein